MGEGFQDLLPQELPPLVAWTLYPQGPAPKPWSCCTPGLNWFGETTDSPAASDPPCGSGSGAFPSASMILIGYSFGLRSQPRCERGEQDFLNLLQGKEGTRSLQIIPGTRLHTRAMASPCMSTALQVSHSNAVILEGHQYTSLSSHRRPLLPLWRTSRAILNSPKDGL